MLLFPPSPPALTPAFAGLALLLLQAFGHRIDEARTMPSPTKMYGMVKTLPAAVDGERSP